MKISDIAKVKVDWMEQFGNDPQLRFILKAGCDLTPFKQFRFNQSGNLFYAVADCEVKFFRHDRRDHNGFGGSRYDLRMADDWDASQWRDCQFDEMLWMSGGARRDVKCEILHNDGERILSFAGLWSSSAPAAKKFIGDCVDVSVMPAKYRESLRDAAYLQRQKQKLGIRAYEGLYLASHLTLDFVKEAVDRLAPHLDLYEGDYGWYPMMRDGEPKNPRKGVAYMHPNMSAEQNRILGR